MKRRTIMKFSAIALAAVVAAQTAGTVYAAPGGDMGGMQQGGQMQPGGNMGGMQQMQPGGDMGGMQQMQPGGDMGGMQQMQPGGMTQGSEQMQAPTGQAPTDAPEVPDGETVQTPDDLPELPEGTDGELPELPADADGQAPQGQNGQMPQMGQMPQGQNGQQMGEPMELPEGALNIGAVQAAIDAVEDEDTKTELQSLLDAYTTALGEPGTEPSEDAEDVIAAAQTALQDAIDAAGVEVSDEMPELPEMGANGQMPQMGQMPQGQNGKQMGEPMELPEGALNIGAVQAAIDAMEDGDSKTELQSLLDAYTTALEETGTEPSEDAEDVIAAAQTALQTAIDDAGLTISDEAPEAPEMDEQASENFFQRTASTLGNQLENFYNWLKGLFE
ncbi:MAG: DUF4175 domain-containing protein [Lachnospiraceae bacterium]|nr:DUF4175 domain-containing protein [Lachnospiraceae bacterium]